MSPFLIQRKCFTIAKKYRLARRIISSSLHIIHKGQDYSVKKFPDVNFFIIMVLGYDFTQNINDLWFIMISDGGRLFN